MEGVGLSLSSLSTLVLFLEGLRFLLPELSLDLLFFFSSFLLTRTLDFDFLLRFLDFPRLLDVLLGPAPSSLPDEL